VSSNDRDRDEILRLREENLRLREENLQKTAYNTSNKADAHIVNVKQVNESFLSGCAGVIGMLFIIAFLLSKCGG
jgi:hypothetical protein